MTTEVPNSSRALHPPSIWFENGGRVDQALVLAWEFDLRNALRSAN